jgi:hypothetical protein
MAKQKTTRAILTTEEERAVHSTLADAQKNRPERRKTWRLFTVTGPDGKQRFVWTAYKETALFRVALADGYSFVDPGRTPSKDKVANLLAALPAEDRAALFAQYKGGKSK